METTDWRWTLSRTTQVQEPIKIQMVQLNKAYKNIAKQ